MFGEIIRSFRKQSGLSQLDFVNALQKSSSNFDNLDVVTLSRWERGATKPHLNRQNEILDMLGVDEVSLRLQLSMVKYWGTCSQSVTVLPLIF